MLQKPLQPLRNKKKKKTEKNAKDYNKNWSLRKPSCQTIARQHMNIQFQLKNSTFQTTKKHQHIMTKKPVIDRDEMQDRQLKNMKHIKESVITKQKYMNKNSSKITPKQQYNVPNITVK